MKRLYSLDALRGVAALSVVLWHWQHFYAMTGNWQDGWQRTAEPLYPLLKPFYLQGWVAVDLFFALSGFVFFWLYAGTIARSEVTAGQFALKRISRLYPLHLLTLLAVVGLQYSFRRTTGNTFIFDATDPGRFAAHLVLAQQWLPPSLVQTFNGPSWTVSIEAGMYVVFFLCRRGFNGPKTALAMVLVGLALIGWDEFIARGLIGFFLGGIVYFAVDRWRRHPKAAVIARVLMIATLVLWTVALVEATFGSASAWLRGALERNVPAAGRFYVGYNTKIFLTLYDLTVIPTTIAALALRESLPNAKAPGRICLALSKLGDISFSTYMLHFPLQIAVALLALRLGFTTALFERPLTLLAFYGLLIGLATLSWHGFEQPMQQILRKMVARR